MISLWTFNPWMFVKKTRKETRDNEFYTGSILQESTSSLLLATRARSFPLYQIVLQEL